MRTSDSLQELTAALAKAQGQMEAAKKDSLNNGLKNEAGKIAKYADLASVWEAIREPLSANGLAVIQAPGAINIRSRETMEVKKYDKYKGTNFTVTETIVDAVIPITTRLAHSSGEFIEEVLEMPVLALTPHAIGSAITYGRRYSLAALTGCVQDDDDGNGAGKISEEPKEQPKQDPPKNQGKGQPPKNQPPKKEDPKPAPAPAPAPEQKKEDPKPAPVDTPAAPPASPLKPILAAKAALNMSDDDLKFATKTILGTETLRGLGAAEYNKLGIFLQGLIDDKIPFSKWKQDRENDDKILNDSLNKDVPEFPNA